MRNLKAAVAFLLFISISTLPSIANISSLVHESDISRQSVVAVSIKDADTGEIIFANDDNKLMFSASLMKLFSFAAILDVLGPNYMFKTSIFENNNNLYIKLGADPLLSSADLKFLVKTLKQNFDISKIAHIYIDDSIIDKEASPFGWCQDDLWPAGPILSPYTLNGNKTIVKIEADGSSAETKIIQNNPYKHKFINNAIIGNGNWANFSAKNAEQKDVLSLNGVISKGVALPVPVFSPMRNFCDNLLYVLRNEGISYNEPLRLMRAPPDANKLAEVNHSLAQVSKSILHDSNNFTAEIAFKVAGAKFKGKILNGKTEDGLDMFRSFYKKIGADTSVIKNVDGSGLSVCNLVTADWITNALILLKNRSDIRKYLMQPGSGSLSERLHGLKDNLRVKTGMLNGLSALCGYAQAHSGRNYVFAIIIANYKRDRAEVKHLIDDIVREIVEL